MKKSEVKELIREEIKAFLLEEQPYFPKGGNIGGPHKQPIKDKEFKSTQKSGTTGNQHRINDERYNKAVSRLFGVNWYDNKDNPMQYTFERNLKFLEDMIGYWKGRRKSSAPENYTSELNNVKSILSDFPKEFAKHFGIDRNSDKSIISFLDQGTDSFLGNYEEYKKLPLKRHDLEEQSQPQASPEAMEEMRDWVKDCQWGDITEEDIDEMSDEEIIKGIKKHYSGGLKGFLQSIGETMVDETTVVDKTTDVSKVSDIARTEKKDVNTVKTAVDQAKLSGKPVTIS